MQAYTEKIVIDYFVRDLCFRPYPNHPKGCPNYGKRPKRPSPYPELDCPPRCPKVEDYFDLSQGFWIVWVEFDFAAHVRRMARKHPDWTQRQKECCLYWQGGVRKKLREAVQDVSYYLEGRGNWQATDYPEAMGVNVTATMRNLDVKLEWPPKTIVYKVAIIGVKK